ncbi:MAG: hypothetical protein Q8N23_15225 [Archangium sp.]|nr:hypothetical protein [Archangium sp.]MDP3570073.1 hypothetical protein [Archangium sp.]
MTRPSPIARSSAAEALKRVAFVVAVFALPAFAQEDGGGAMGIETFEEVDAGTPVVAPLETFKSEPAAPTVRVYGWTSAYTSLDTRFDSPRGAALAENVWEGRLRAVLGVDVKLNEHVRLVLEGRAQVRGATQRDFDRAKGFFEPMLGDAFVDLYTSKVDLRVGNQRIPLGANAALAPADALNPRDLRESSGDLEDALLPVFAIRAQGELGKLSWLAAYVPFFQPHRLFVFGQDEGVLQPAFGQSLDNRRIDPSVEDFLQDRVLETQRPPPFAGDLALRVTAEGRVKVGASWVWMNEKLSRVTVDPELARVLAAQAAGRTPDQAGAVSVLNRFQAGETLYRGFYGRQHLFSAEASALLGPGQLDVDFTYSPRQTFYDADFSPVDKASVTLVASYSQASDSPLLYSISYLGMALPDIGAREQLIILEPATSVGAAHTAFFHLFIGVLGYTFWDKRFEVSFRGTFEPVQQSFSLAPRVTYQGIEGLKLFVAAEFYEGKPWSPFGYFDRNDRVLLGARYELF